MDRQLQSLVRTADRVTVDTVAQQPYCVEERFTLAETYRHAREQQFTLLPVREATGIHKAIFTEQLEGLSSWGQVLDQSKPIRLNQIVARQAPLLSLLDRVEAGTTLLTLGGEGIDGVVTLYDLNQPAAHLFSFGLALVVEAAVGGAISEALGQPPFPKLKDDLLRLARETKCGGSLQRLEKFGTTDDFLDPMTCLSFEQKVTIVKQKGVDLLIERSKGKYAGRRDQLLSELGEVVQLRNAVAHQRDDLDEYTKTCRRMRIANDLAHLLSPAEAMPTMTPDDLVRSR